MKPTIAVGAMVYALNGPGFEQPSIASVDYDDVGICTCLVLPDRSAIALPGLTGVEIGLVMVEAALSDVEFLDPVIYARLTDHLERLRTVVAALETDGKVRPTDRARLQ